MCQNFLGINIHGIGTKYIFTQSVKRFEFIFVKQHLTANSQQSLYVIYTKVKQGHCEATK